MTTTTLSPPGSDAAIATGVLGRLSAATPGPTLVAVGGVHGNEPAGVVALERVLRALERAGLAAGDLIALVGNRPALDARRRFLERDLNRGWHPAIATAGRVATIDEEVERQRLHAALVAARAQARGRCFFLDLHTTSGPSHPFTSAPDTLPSRRFASALAAPVVLGLDDALPGTFTRHADQLGLIALSFEAGQHDETRSIDYAEAAVWLALDRAGLLSPAVSDAHAPAARRLFDGTGWEARHMFDVTYRHALTPGNDFRMHPGHSSFDRVARGQPLGNERGHVVASPNDGYLLMPLYQSQGDDGFFVMRQYGPARQLGSRLLRRARAERLLVLGSGARITSEETLSLPRPGARRRLVRSLLHLLGYRAFEQAGDRVIARRRRQRAPE